MSAALWEAVQKRTLKAFQVAIDGGADINAKNPDDDDNTALMRIVKSKSGVMSKTEVAIAMSLIEKDADVSTTNDNGETPLHMAAASGNLEVLEALVVSR
jgi:ankyrin repeat protein